MLKLDGKKEETSLGIYQFWPRKNDLQKWKDSSVSYDRQRWIIETSILLYKENIWRIYLFY